ncbi:hypothetical protein [Leucobacter sp. USHLN153]|uniref:hypothetical protein n=1 Tax=Leucobacter sp. USHLN153 TaxID=3081268 RepID=UPI003019A154
MNNGPDDAAEKHQLLASVALDLKHAARDRARTVTNKASFLAVSAGVLITAALTYAWTLKDWSTALPLIAAVISLGFASYAMRPEPAEETSLEELTDLFFESKAKTVDLQDHLLKSYKAVIRSREDATRKNSKAVRAGYILLLVAGLSLTILFIVDQALKG